VIADVDGDGLLDVVVADYKTVRYFHNTGSATVPVFTELTGSANPFAVCAAITARTWLW